MDLSKSSIAAPMYNAYAYIYAIMCAYVYSLWLDAVARNIHGGDVTSKKLLYLEINCT